MKLLHLSLVISSIALSGCQQAAPKENAWATGQLFGSLEHPSSGHALLYLMRQKSFHRENEWPIVSLNNKPIVKLKNTGYTYIQIDPGEYRVTTDDTDWAKDVTISLEANKTYFLALVIDKNISRGHAEAITEMLLNGYIGEAPSRATRKWSLLKRDDAVFNLQHYRYTPLLEKSTK